LNRKITNLKKFVPGQKKQSKYAFKAAVFCLEERERNPQEAQGRTNFGGTTDICRRRSQLEAGGVGKTTLIKLLDGEYATLMQPPGLYKESLGVEKTRVRLTSKDKNKKSTTLHTEIVVTPGQKHRRDSTWTGYHQRLQEAKFVG